MKPLRFAFVLVIGTLVCAAAAFSQTDTASKVVVERVGDTAFIQLHAPSFEALTPRQQALAYWPVSYTHLDVYKRQPSSCSTVRCK